MKLSDNLTQVLEEKGKLTKLEDSGLWGFWFYKVWTSS
jgi:hypothetical protein